MEQLTLLWILVLPLLGVAISHILPTSRLRDGVLAGLGVVLFIQVAMLLQGITDPAQQAQSVLNWEQLDVTLFEIMPGIRMSLSVESTGLIFALIASFLWTVTTIFSSGYMHNNQEKNQARFYSCFSIAIFGAMGIAFSANLFTLFVFYELLTLSTFPLVTHSGTKQAHASGRVYLGVLLGSSIAFFLTAIIAVYVLTGTLEFTPGGVIAGHVSPLTAGLLLLLFVYGIGKAALMPMHKWLPAAMVAPTPVSALLHAVAVVKAGVFAIVKIVIYIFGVDSLAELTNQNVLASGWLVYISGTTIVVASFIALRQDNLKKRLAYSTISQLSYVILAVSLLTHYAVVAAAFHIAAHAFGKITLFFSAGAIYTASKKTEISQMGGIGRRMPFTLFAFSIGALSMIGIPPAVGFLTKYYLLMGVMETEHWFALGVVIISTLLNAAYFLPIIINGYFGDEPEKLPRKIKKGHGEAPPSQVFALAITSGMTIAICIYPDIFLELANLALIK